MCLIKVKSSNRPKHCENCKKLPREHLIGCQGVKMFLLKRHFKVFFRHLNMLYLYYTNKGLTQISESCLLKAFHGTSFLIFM